MRKLASVQRILALDPIPGADAIEVATVLGWKVVVKKGLHEVGDLVVYLEIDSVPPLNHWSTPYFEFLWEKYAERPRNYRIKTMKLRGQVSQGLIMPLSIIDSFDYPLAEGDDLTEILGLTKYEPVLPSSDEIIGEFMPGVFKTDEPRLQSNPSLLDELRGRPFIITEKADGASMTMGIVDGEFAVYGRNYRLRDDNGPYWRAARLDPFEEWLRDNPGYALQGELVGPGVQGNKLEFVHNTCLIFNVFDVQNQVRLSPANDFLLDANLPTVRTLFVGEYFDMSLDELLDIATNGIGVFSKNYPGTKNRREGIVVRNSDDEKYVSFKVISPEYLLKGGE